jgi:CubicO group peptidase (beta-lactamase class C family)
MLHHRGMNLFQNQDTASSRLKGHVERLLEKRHVKHAILAVESVDGIFRWIGAAGAADPGGTSMCPDTPFHIASIDKLYTASAVMRLKEDKRVCLDEPVIAYLPLTLVDGMHRLGGVDYTDKITVRHLLGHTSGLADCLEDRPRGGQSLMERVFEDADMSFSIEDLMEIVRHDLTPHFPPQSPHERRQRARYSDTNFQLLIAIIERVTGQPLYRVFEEMFFRPLSLDSTWFYGYSKPLESVIDHAILWFEDKPLDLPLAMQSFPSIYSTAEDCLVFLRALIRGEVFRERGTLELMRERFNRFRFAVDPAALRSPGWPVEYGLGIMRFRLPRVFTPFRPVPAVVGHTGSTGCWLFHCPDLDLLLCGTVDQAAAGAVPFRFVPGLLRELGSLDGKR